MANDSTDKRLPRLLCEPHDGSRSLKFLKFKRDYRTSMRAEFLPDDEHSLWTANIGLDPGGDDPNAPAMPAAGEVPCLRDHR